MNIAKLVCCLLENPHPAVRTQMQYPIMEKQIAQEYNYYRYEDHISKRKKGELLIRYEFENSAE